MWTKVSVYRTQRIPGPIGILTGKSEQKSTRNHLLIVLYQGCEGGDGAPEDSEAA